MGYENFVLMAVPTAPRRTWTGTRLRPSPTRSRRRRVWTRATPAPGSAPQELFLEAPGSWLKRWIPGACSRWPTGNPRWTRAAWIISAPAPRWPTRIRHRVRLGRRSPAWASSGRRSGSPGIPLPPPMTRWRAPAARCARPNSLRGLHCPPNCHRTPARWRRPETGLGSLVDPARRLPGASRIPPSPAPWLATAPATKTGRCGRGCCGRGRCGRGRCGRGRCGGERCGGERCGGERCGGERCGRRFIHRIRPGAPPVGDALPRPSGRTTTVRCDAVAQACR